MRRIIFAHHAETARLRGTELAGFQDEMQARYVIRHPSHRVFQVTCGANKDVFFINLRPCFYMRF